ncbi:MAG: hypothetical protein JJU28_17025 [Cyclobacteriaceae bacterium]|nr:hypothetical protein [Cyclobacteriaceae bacterium]
MKNVVPFTILVFICLSCGPDKSADLDPEIPKFNTTDAAELFFKNLRSPYYDLEDREDVKMLVYRFSKRNKTEEKPILGLALVIHWIKDEAFLLFEPNHFFDTPEPVVIYCTNPETSEITKLSFYRADVRTQFTLAVNLYKMLQQKFIFEIHIGDHSYLLFEDEKEREAFRITVYDFLRLVELI